MIIPPHSAAIQTARFEDNVATREHKIEHKNKNRKIKKKLANPQSSKKPPEKVQMQT